MKSLNVDLYRWKRRNRNFHCYFSVLPEVRFAPDGLTFEATEQFLLDGSV